MTEYEETNNIVSSEKKPKKIKSSVSCLLPFYNENPQIIEFGVDEAGRGPLFGRVYSASVILPKDDSFHHFLMKDSKKFHSKKKIEDVCKYIKENALAWSVAFSDESTIDSINILQATQQAMHQAISETEKKYMQKTNDCYEKKQMILVDGNYFNPMTRFNKELQKIEVTPHICIEGGDNKYSAIAAASILAKVERDKYIEELCALHPELVEKYDIANNKGYGTKKHIAGIKEHGLSEWHRKSFRLKKHSPQEI
jgi:ribonuclease HII